MQIDSNNLIRKLPAMIQGRRKFAKIADGGDYHVGAVDDWCLTYKEVVQAIEDYCAYMKTARKQRTQEGRKENEQVRNSL